MARQIFSWQRMRMGFGALLLGAALLKAVHLWSVPYSVSGLDLKWLRLAVIGVEALVGFLLISRPADLFGWFSTFVLFCAFSVVSVLAALAREQSCRCLGPISINPLYMSVFDVAAVAALWFCRPEEETRLSSIRWNGLTGVLFTAIAVGSMGMWYRMTTFPVFSLEEVGLGDGGGKTVLLEPEQWLGKSFPLLDHVLIESDLSRGAWLVVVVHLDCPQCQQVIRGLKSRATSAERIAIIAVPPSGEESSRLPPAARGTISFGQLRRGPDWFVRTPAIIRLVDGQVIAVDYSLVSG